MLFLLMSGEAPLCIRFRHFEPLLSAMGAAFGLIKTEGIVTVLFGRRKDKRAFTLDTKEGSVSHDALDWDPFRLLVTGLF